MYGYVRPDRDELLVREYRQFQSVYCGLCEALRREYGIAARFVLSYDMTFLAMALSPREESSPRRCMAHPLRKRPCICGDEALRRVADMSVILVWWKLCDNAEDEKRFRRLLSKLGKRLLRRAYRKAAGRESTFAAETETQIRRLSALEKENASSLDETADCFASLLASAGDAAEGGKERRVCRELFYHVGRIVYLMDAADDLREDGEKGRFNPLVSHFSLTVHELSEEQKRELLGTIYLSQHRAAAALELRQEDSWQPILRNIVTRGLPEAAGLVLSGKWKETVRRGKYSGRGRER